MNLADMIHRQVALPWAEGDNIPWNDPGFSKRMLNEHLSQEHDHASRRSSIIDQHVAFLHHTFLHEKPGRVLDLGCGPGLYSQRLAKLGHQVQGIDFSPASIDYAEQQARKEETDCVFTQADIREAPFGVQQYDLAMLIFGEFNVFKPLDGALILKKAYQALKPGGFLVLEPSVPETLSIVGQAQATWYSSESGLFSDQPHLVLQEVFWEETERIVTRRYYCIDAATGAVERYASSLKAYEAAEIEQMLFQVGFGHVQCFPSLDGSNQTGDFFVISAQR